MSLITEQSISAFMNKRRFKKQNTEVYVGEFSTILLLHGNTIAIKYHDSDVIEITTCGWNTRTTRNRLNGIKNVTVRSRKGHLSVNNIPWDGKLVNIKDYERDFN